MKPAIQPVRSMLAGRFFVSSMLLLAASVPAREAVILEMEAAPAAKLHSAGKSAVKSQVGALDKAQRSFLKDAAVVAPQATILFRTQRVYNGVAFLANGREATDLASLPGVKRLHRLALVEPSTSLSVPFVGAQALWSSGNGLLGEGIRIGIIDSGIDYLHADFGGAGGYGSNNTTVIGDVEGFPGTRVVGGWDFVGDSYNANVEANSTPQPDPDPMDCGGHGTHVAGIAAGTGVLPGGATYGGPWNNSTASTAFQVGPGVAPASELYSLRIFGCGGSSAILVPAIEWAMDPNGDGDLSDHLDVVNMSLGSPVGFEESPEAVATNIASEAGIIMVAAAGNSRNTYYVLGLPAVASKAIAVGGSLAPKTIDPATGAPAQGDTTADTMFTLSSRGPDPTAFLKPDVSAPAVAFSAKVSSGTAGWTLSGTSMACPHVAGAVALLKQQHPAWTGTELKALLMNTAHNVWSSNINSAPLAGPARVGAGRIELRSAASANVIAFDSQEPERVSVSFGKFAVSAPEQVFRSVTVRNKGDERVVYTLQIETVTDTPGVGFALPVPPSVAVGAGSDATFSVGVTLDPSRMIHQMDTTPPATRDHHWMSEEGGYVALVPDDGGVTIRVPLFAIARPISAMELEEALLLADANTTSTLSVHRTGTGLNTGTNRPYDIGSLAEGFELQFDDGREATLPTPPASAADLRYVGARRLDPDTIAFGIATWEPFPSLNHVSFELGIDTNRDGTSDFLVSTLTNPDAPTDEFRTRIRNLSSGQETLGEPLNRWPAYLYDTAIYNSTVVVVPVRLSSLGLTNQPGRINYFLLSSYTGGGEVLPVEFTPDLTFDPDAPGLRFDSTSSEDQPGEVLDMQYSASAFEANRSLGLLMLHHHNAPGSQAEVVPVEQIVVRGTGFAVY